jgi:Fe2+ transport system protein FeoA
MKKEKEITKSELKELINNLFKMGVNPLDAVKVMKSSGASDELIIETLRSQSDSGR